MHALNTIAQKIRNGNTVNRESLKKLDKAHVTLERIMSIHEDIVAELEDVQDQNMVFLDRYRRKSKRRKQRQSPSGAPPTEIQ